MKLPLQILSLSLLLTGAAHAQGGPITTERLTITGPGSTGPIDGMTAGGMPLSDLVASTAYMPPPSGNAATDAANFAAAQAKSVRSIVFQAGTYLIAACGWPELKSGQEVVGQGPGRTILRNTAQCTNDNGLLYAREESDLAVRQLTLDYGDFPDWSKIVSPLAFLDVQRVAVEDVDILNWNRFGLFINAGSDIRVDRVRLIRSSNPRLASGAAVPLGHQNQCVTASNDYKPVSRVLFQDVYCKGSAFISNGVDIDYVRTEVDGFDYGNAYVTEKRPQNGRQRFFQVKGHDGRTNPATGLDENSTSAGCMEIWTVETVVDGMDCYDVGGGGIAIGAKNSLIVNNRFRGLGKQVPSDAIGARYENNGTYSASGSLIANNVVINTNGSGDGSNLRYPYAEQSTGADLKLRIFGNDFAGISLPRKGEGALWGSPGLLLPSTTTNAVFIGAGATVGVTAVTFPGALRASDTIQGVTFTATGGGALPDGLRVFGEVRTDNNVTFYVQNLTGAAITLPAGTFAARLIGIR